MVRGTVKWFDNIKGYGFITQENGGKDVFVHVNNVHTPDGLREGDKVEFNVINSQKGLNAESVRVVS